MCCIDGSTRVINPKGNYVEAVNISPAQARLKLTVLNKQAEAKNSWEFFSEMKSLGLPAEVIEILKKVLEVTSKVANKTIAIGKIIVSKLLRYTAEHPLQVAGLAVGLYATYTLGIALHGMFATASWIAGIPVIGTLVGKLALLIAGLCKTVIMPIMVMFPAAGAVGGEILDRKLPQISESCQKMAEEYFKLLNQIIDAIKDELESNERSPAFS